MWSYEVCGHVIFILKPRTCGLMWFVNQFTFVSSTERSPCSHTHWLGDENHDIDSSDFLLREATSVFVFACSRRWPRKQLWVMWLIGDSAKCYFCLAGENTYHNWRVVVSIWRYNLLMWLCVCVNKSDHWLICGMIWTWPYEAMFMSQAAPH